MSKEKQILQLRTKGYSQRRIANTLKVSRNTVAKVFKALQDHPVFKDSLNSLNDQELRQQLFPEESQVPVLVTPDYDYVHKELLKSGVTLKLLWEEYVDTCRRSEKPPYCY
ncbi:helix-turn-helix domain-containing protein [Desulfoscipio sp. XC116]|uniref:helix-turn-helix domain-containing protein n=1 Tax=Desulfoscipio sp. XC116 TaxID=3144975 RepID=UPI00325BF2F3